MKVKESVKGNKKIIETVEENKNAPSATSDSQSQGGESSQQDKKEKTRKKINPQQHRTQAWKKRDLKFDPEDPALIALLAKIVYDPNDKDSKKDNKRS